MACRLQMLLASVLLLTASTANAREPTSYRGIAPMADYDDCLVSTAAMSGDYLGSRAHLWFVAERSSVKEPRHRVTLWWPSRSHVATRTTWSHADLTEFFFGFDVFDTAEQIEVDSFAGNVEMNLLTDAGRTDVRGHMAWSPRYC